MTVKEDLPSVLATTKDEKNSGRTSMTNANWLEFILFLVLLIGTTPGQKVTVFQVKKQNLQGLYLLVAFLSHTILRWPTHRNSLFIGMERKINS